MTPKISVIMSVYNGDNHLRESIESILTQTFTNFEFIIVNDGSTDASLQIIQTYNDKRIRIINNQENIGLTKSLNKALKQAQGEYIARQDADDLSLRNRLELQLEFLDSHPEIAVLGTGIYVINERGEVIEKRIMAPNPIKSLAKGNRFIHGSVMIRKSVIDVMGGYIEYLKYSQDYELWLRISRKYDVINLKAALYMLRFHGGSISIDKIKEQQMCALLAKKLAFGEIKENELKDHEILDLYHILNKKEKVRFHKSLAYSYTQSGELGSLRRECLKAFLLNPFDVENSVYLIFSTFGVKPVLFAHQIYRYMRYVLYKIFGFDF